MVYIRTLQNPKYNFTFLYTYFIKYFIVSSNTPNTSFKYIVSIVINLITGQSKSPSCDNKKNSKDYFV